MPVESRGEEWWKDGIPFTCLPDCGRCCNEPNGIVHLSIDDAECLAEYFEIPVEQWLERDCRRRGDGKWVLKSRPVDGICIYLDEDMKCSVYSSKPTQCSAFPWWNENLRSERSWRKVVRNCPGLSVENAPVVNAEDIQMWIEADRNASLGFRKYQKSNGF